jgi:hypothetical protein
MSATNGDNPRLDRIEKILEVITREHPILLRAQVVLDDQTNKFNELMTRLSEKLDKIADARLQRKTARSEKIDEQLRALIKIVEDNARRRRGLA